MFAKLGDYLSQHNIQRPTRYAAPSGEEFVILPAKDYTLLTGIDMDALPSVEMFDSVASMPEEDAIQDRSSFEEAAPVSVLVTMQLEEEIGVDRLPL